MISIWGLCHVGLGFFEVEYNEQKDKIKKSDPVWEKDERTERKGRIVHI